MRGEGEDISDRRLVYRWFCGETYGLLKASCADMYICRMEERCLGRMGIISPHILVSPRPDIRQAPKRCDAPTHTISLPNSPPQVTRLIEGHQSEINRANLGTPAPCTPVRDCHGGKKDKVSSWFKGRKTMDISDHKAPTSLDIPPFPMPVPIPDPHQHNVTLPNPNRNRKPTPTRRTSTAPPHPKAGPQPTSPPASPALSVSCRPQQQPYLRSPPPPPPP